MSQNRENYCYILGLNPFRDYSLDDINRKINEAENKWAQALQDPTTPEEERIKLKSLQKSLGHIKTTMNSKVYRPSEFNSARSELRIKATLLLRNSVRLHDGTRVINPKQVEEALKNLGWGDVGEEDLMKCTKLEFGEMPDFIEGTTRIAYNKMKSIGFTDPVELANELINNPLLNLGIPALDGYTTTSAIRETFDLLSRTLRGASTQLFEEQSTYFDVIRVVNHAMKQDDDRTNELLNYCRCMNACKKSFSTLDLDVGHRFNKSFLDMVILDASHGDPYDRSMYTSILEEYCIKKNYAADFFDEDNTLSACPKCKMLYVDRDDIRFCQECGEPLKHRCPLCGHVQAASGSICTSCGRDIVQANEEAKELCEKADKQCQELDIEGAEITLNSLCAEYRHYDPDPLPEKIYDTKKAIETLRNDTWNYYSTGLFYRLCELVRENRTRYPLEKIKDVEDRYEQAKNRVMAAERLCLEAATLSGEQRTDRYIQAAEMCPDHPDAKNNLKDRIPLGPKAESIEVDRSGVTLRYIVPEDRRGMKFQIYRSEGGFPRNSEDAVAIGVTENNMYQDKSADPGKMYYYRVHSLRWGILSQDYAEYGPALILKEVSDIEITAEEDCIKIGFKNPRNCHRVRVFKKCGGSAAGEDEEIELNFGGRYIEDRDVKDGETYYYLFYTEYNICGEMKRTNGVIREVTVPRLPDPIERLNIKWNKDEGSYTVGWDVSGEVELFVSPERHALRNTVVNLKDVQGSMTRIIGKRTDKSCTFVPPFAGSMYLYPLTVFGDKAVTGREYTIKILEPIHSLTKNVEGDTCRLVFEWPNSAIGVKMNVDGKNQRISREEYERTGYLFFKLGNGLGTEVELRMIYEKDTVDDHMDPGTERLEEYSIPVSLKVYHNNYNRVSYTLYSSRASNDKKKTNIRIAIRSDVPTLPKMVVVYSEERYPLKMSDGYKMSESDEPVVLTDGYAEMSFTIDRSSIDLNNMKLFFEDPESYNYLRFIHPVPRRS